jgi:hypothetical protein
VEAREAVRLFEVSCRYLVANGFALPTGLIHTLPSGLIHTLPSGLIHTLPSGLIHTLPSGLIHTLPSGLIHTLPSGAIDDDNAVSGVPENIGAGD